MQMQGLAAALLAWWLLLLVVALRGEARLVPNTRGEYSTTAALAYPLCGPLQKHRLRCIIDPPQDPPSGSLPSEVSTSAAAAAVGDPEVDFAAATIPSVTPTSEGKYRGDPECGPLEKHRFRCNPPLTQIHANSGAGSGLTATDIEASSIQGHDLADGQTEEITESTSGAADHVGDDIEVVATIPSELTPTSELGDREDPECGPLEKHRFRCNPPLTRKDNLVVP